MGACEIHTYHSLKLHCMQDLSNVQADMAAIRCRAANNNRSPGFSQKTQMRPACAVINFTRFSLRVYTRLSDSVAITANLDVASTQLACT